MPRRPRVLLEGGHYQVYNRCARGEEIFADAKEARAFLDLLREVRDRDGLTVLAWCLMSNHYHLAVRTASVSLARSMKAIQGGYSRSFNRRWRRTGALRQSRCQARLVGSLEHLAQVVVYIHLNPVRAGIVGRAEEYRLSGHREILGRVGSPLLNVNESLLTFGERCGWLARATSTGSGSRGNQRARQGHCRFRAFGTG